MRPMGYNWSCYMMKKTLLALFLSFAFVPTFAQATFEDDFNNLSNRPFNMDGDWYGIDTVWYSNNKVNDPVDHFRYVYSYDDKGNTVGGKMDQCVDGVYEPHAYFEKEFDEFCRDTVSAHYSWRNSFSRYMKDRRYAYSYDRNGNLTKKFQQEGSRDENDEWVNIDLYRYEYNDDNFLMHYEMIFYGHEAESHYNINDSYERDEHNNVVNYSHIIFLNGYYYCLYESIEYQYDEQGNMTDSVCRTSEDSLNWLNTMRVTKSYDGYGNMTERTEYEWDEDNADWIPIRQEGWCYDGAGRDTLATIALWNSDTQDFELNRTNRYAYNEAGIMVSRLSYGFGETDRWHFLGSYDCEIGENGDVLMEQTIYQDSLSGWRESCQEDPFENVYYRLEERLDTLNGWNNVRHQLFYYDENRNDTLALNYKWSAGEWMPSYTDIIINYNNKQSLARYSSHWVHVKYKKIPHHSQVEEIVNENNIVVYPNPMTDKLTLVGEGLNLAEVYDICGRRILSVSLNQNDENAIDVSLLSSGLYLLKVTTSVGKTNTCKIVK